MRYSGITDPKNDDSLFSSHQPTHLPMQTETQSLYDRLGGMPAVDAAVDIFYRKVLADPRINGFFAGIDMDRQAGMLKGFMAFAFGAPMNYSGRSLREAHQHMRLTDLHFGAVAGHLGSTLQELNVPDELIREATQI